MKNCEECGKLSARTICEDCVNAAMQGLAAILVENGRFPTLEAALIFMHNLETDDVPEQHDADRVRFPL